MIGIVDYGLGNVASIKNSLQVLNIDSEIFRDHNKIDKYSRIILPGVGGFKLAVNNLHKFNLFNKIIEFSKKKPILGICLGMQLLLSYGYESGKSKGLGLINGEVKLIEANKKLPHVGWNNLTLINNHEIFNNINFNSDFYFIHSYECILDENKYINTTTNFDKIITSSISKGNIIGVQYHPEKSQKEGLRILKNFNSIKY